MQYLDQVVIDKDIDKLSDIATISIPGMHVAKSLDAEKFIKRGMPIEINLGYDNDLQKEFTGYVASVTTDNNILIRCEDGMFDFHVPAENRMFRDIPAPDLIYQLLQKSGLDYGVTVGENADSIIFDSFEIRDVTVYEALAKIKSQTGYNIYLRGKELFVQLRHFSDAIDNEGVYDFSKNVEKSNLTYMEASERILQVEVVGMTRSNTKVTVTVGIPGGDKITHLAYNVSKKEQLEAIGNEILKRYSYTGYTGDLTGWLLPYVSYGWKGKIINPDYNLREGKYFIDRVKTTFNEQGGSRKVGLGVKLG